jgi:hypothetical protein
VPKQTKAELPAALRPLYAARYRQIVMGRIMHEELSRQFDRLPSDADGMIQIDTATVSFDERMRRAMCKVAHGLRLADISLASWADLLEFAELVQITAAQGIAMLDDSDQETLDALAASITPEVDPERRAAAEMVVILANFIQRCEPRVRRAGYHYVHSLEEANAGVVLVRDANSVRDIYPLARAS